MLSMLTCVVQGGCIHKARRPLKSLTDESLFASDATQQTNEFEPSDSKQHSQKVNAAKNVTVVLVLSMLTCVIQCGCIHKTGRLLVVLTEQTMRPQQS